MEIINPPGWDDNPKPMSFHGQGSTYFGIVVVNFIFTVITFGLYYPWAKARIRQYIWSETEFEDSRFVFHGTGAEMFKGFVIAYASLFIFYLLFFLMSTDGGSWLARWAFFCFLLIMFFWFMPFAIFSSWRYRLTRTSWRGIFFTFEGRYSEFFRVYLKYFIVTVFTLGLGYNWLKVAMQKELFSKTRIGDLKMNFHGNGADLFAINLLGYILLYPTLGLYVPKWIKERFKFTINHTSLSDETKRRALNTNLTFGHTFQILITNFILLIITLGLAYPFTKMRYLRMLIDSVDLPGEMDYDDLKQGELRDTEATGDQLLDILDLDIDF